MQIESTLEPTAFDEVERVGDVARVTMRRNVELVERDGEGSVWAWEEYSYECPWFDGVEDAVRENADAWLDIAQRVPTQAALDEAARLKERLAETDADVVRRVEGLFACGSITELLSWLASARAECAQTLAERKAWRERIEEIEEACR